MSIVVPGQIDPHLSGIVLGCEADDGSRAIAVRRSIYGGQIIGGVDEFGCNDVWSYTFLTTAVLEFMQWSGEAGTEPDGWIRHQPSGRRRPDGDATREYFAL